MHTDQIFFYIYVCIYVYIMCELRYLKLSTFLISCCDIKLALGKTSHFDYTPFAFDMLHFLLYLSCQCLQEAVPKRSARGDQISEAPTATLLHFSPPTASTTIG